MKIKRFANNETFIQNIIRSIDSNEHNYRRNYSAFYRFFNEKFEEALAKTKQDIYGSRRTSAKYKVRIK